MAAAGWKDASQLLDALVAYILAGTVSPGYIMAIAMALTAWAPRDGNPWFSGTARMLMNFAA